MTKYTDAYDHWLQASWEAHMPPEYPWAWFKAQMLAESGGNPQARSPVGALGLFQFMPDTWGDVKEALNFPTLASPLDPQYAIQGAAFYMRQLWNMWTAPRPALDRLHLAQAAYNCGVGNVLAAQRHARAGAGGVINDYATISEYLPSETHAYVLAIGGYYLELSDATLAPVSS